MWLMHLTAGLTGLATGVFLALSANLAGHGVALILVFALLGGIGGYIGTWLAFLAAVLLLSIASGIALGVVPVLSVFCFFTVILTFFV
jgi:hypothetical protein